MVRAEGVFFFLDNVDIAVNLEIAAVKISCSSLSGIQCINLQPRCFCSCPCPLSVRHDQRPPLQKKFSSGGSLHCFFQRSRCLLRNRPPRRRSLCLLPHRCFHPVSHLISPYLPCHPQPPSYRQLHRPLLHLMRAQPEYFPHWKRSRCLLQYQPFLRLFPRKDRLCPQGSRCCHGLCRIRSGAVSHRLYYYQYCQKEPPLQQPFREHREGHRRDGSCMNILLPGQYAGSSPYLFLLPPSMRSVLPVSRYPVCLKTDHPAWDLIHLSVL